MDVLARQVRDKTLFRLGHGEAAALSFRVSLWKCLPGFSVEKWCNQESVLVWEWLVLFLPVAFIP